MKIALIGTRGVPALYGGFETCAEEIGKRLVQRKHRVTVYCRTSYYNKKLSEYLGMQLVYLPELSIKFLETLSHTFFSILHALTKKFDILFIFNAANSPWAIFPSIIKKRVVLHVDGLEWKREKWSSLGKKYYRFSEWLAAKIPVTLIADSKEIKKYYRENYEKDAQFISYGAPLQNSQDRSLIRRFGLEPDDYFLQVTRFEPENNPLTTVKAFERLETSKKLVLVGGVKYKTAYSESTCETADERIKFPGFIYDKNILRELFCNCYAYIHGNEVGGTNPALLQAMASGCFVICRDVPFNREVLSETGIYFKKDPDDLLSCLVWSLQNAEILQTKKEGALQIIKEHYDWEKVVDAYEKLFIGA